MQTRRAYGAAIEGFFRTAGITVLAAARRVAPEKRITPHGLRKTFIELALAEGEPLEAICNATGHARPELLNYYAGGRKLRKNAIHTVAGKYL